MKYKYYYIINSILKTRHYFFLYKKEILHTANLKSANKFILLSKREHPYNKQNFIYKFLYKGNIYEVIDHEDFILYEI